MPDDWAEANRRSGAPIRLAARAFRKRSTLDCAGTAVLFSTSAKRTEGSTGDTFCEDFLEDERARVEAKTPSESMAGGRSGDAFSESPLEGERARAAGEELSADTFASSGVAG